MRCGDGQRLTEGVDGAGDLNLELTSLVRGRRTAAAAAAAVAAAALFLSAGTRGGLGFSTVVCFCIAGRDSHRSIRSL